MWEYRFIQCLLNRLDRTINRSAKANLSPANIGSMCDRIVLPLCNRSWVVGSFRLKFLGYSEDMVGRVTLQWVLLFQMKSCKHRNSPQMSFAKRLHTPISDRSFDTGLCQPVSRYFSECFSPIPEAAKYSTLFLWFWGFRVWFAEFAGVRTTVIAIRDTSDIMIGQRGLTYNKKALHYFLVLCSYCDAEINIEFFKRTDWLVLDF